MNNQIKPLIIGALVFLLSLISLACSMNNQQSLYANTSFDDAHLMMITARDILGEYDVEEVASLPGGTQGITLISTSTNINPQSTLEQLNQQFALGLEYKRLAQIAESSGNNVLADKFYAKAENCFNRALDLEKDRIEWRRRHRLNSFINRGVKNIGQAIGNTLDFLGTSAGEYVDAEINGYVDQVRSFLQNPIRYAFDVKMGHQLDIVKHQFTDRLGPFFGQRVYELIGLDEAAWAMEGQIFNKPTQNPVITPSKTKEVDFSAYVGTYSGQLDVSEFFEGSVIANGITLEVEEDGAINGNFQFISENPNDGYFWGGKQLNDHFCESKNVFEYSGMISGQLTSRTGTLEIESKTISSSLLVSDCPPFSEDVSVPYEFTQAAEVRIQDEKITGTISGYCSFELDKE
jgi:hypothetical protein